MKKLMQNIKNKPKLTLVIIVLFSLKSVAQSYTMSNTSVTTCTGTFYDSGGTAGDYGLNQNYIKKFCSDNGQSIKIEFTEFDLDDSYDFLYVYDGTTTSDPLIGIYSQFGPTGAFISSGTCLTFKFTSDGFYNYSGWAGTISCIEQPLCGSNPLANNVCASATYISNLDGYCGNTSATYTADFSADLVSDFCGSIENNSWLKFTADATSANFNVWTSNCSIGDGIQIEIFNTTDCINFTSVSNCWNPFNEVNGAILATGLIIGQDYYMMIDGNGGDVCDFVIGAATGVVVLPTELLSFKSKCINNKSSLEWITVSEINSDYFLLEKSTNGIEFQQIYKTKAANNSSHEIKYAFNDNDYSNGTVYYRLKMVDLDGKIKVSDILSAICSDENNSFSFFPNPTSDNISLNWKLGEDDSAEIIIANINGEILYQNVYYTSIINEKIDLKHLPKGIYHVKLSNQNLIFYEKLVIEK